MSQAQELLSDRIKNLAIDLSLRRKVIEDFIEAYLAHLSGKIPVDNIMDKIELVEQHGNNQIKWYFREKK